MPIPHLPSLAELSISCVFLLCTVQVKIDLPESQEVEMKPCPNCQFTACLCSDEAETFFWNVTATQLGEAEGPEEEGMGAGGDLFLNSLVGVLFSILVCRTSTVVAPNRALMSSYSQATGTLSDGYGSFCRWSPSCS